MAGVEKYFELLELSPEANLDDIRKKYRYLKNLYSGDSIEIRALRDEFPNDVRNDYLARLDEAFEKLNALPEKNRALELQPVKCENEDTRKWLESVECYNGAALREIRLRMNVELKAIFEVTRIQLHLLEDLENEVFTTFGAEVYLRSYLIEYARFLSLNTQKVLDDYLGRYRAWKSS